MTRLNDTQLILLSAAAQRESGSFCPLPDTITGDDARKVKAIDALVKRGLAEVRDSNDKPSICRTNDGIGYGVFITDAGRGAIDAKGTPSDVAAPCPTPPASRITKSALVLDLLGRADGATLAELIDATGWLPHTTRAALTGLRKKGHSIERSKRDDATCYRVVA